MSRQYFTKILTTLSILAALWLGVRYLLPLVWPFLLGAAIAFGAEPLVRFCRDRLRLPRGAAAGISVTMALLLLSAVVVLLAALIVRELAVASGILPDLANTARQGIAALEGWLLELAARMPDGLEGIVTQAVENLFSGGSAFLDRITSWLLGLASGFLKLLPSGALSLGTMVLSAYMISCRLPDLRQRVNAFLGPVWQEKLLPALQDLKAALGGWLRAQAKLAGITFAIVTAGFIILRVIYAPIWAFVVALVDAVPMLGTGTILIPWALVCLIQGETVRAIGLVATYAASALTRSALEPRMVGKQLGLDPLLTLAALYAGYHFWGVGGMLIAPMLAVAATSLLRLREQH